MRLCPIFVSISCHSPRKSFQSGPTIESTDPITPPPAALWLATVHLENLEELYSSPVQSSQTPGPNRVQRISSAVQSSPFTEVPPGRGLQTAAKKESGHDWGIIMKRGMKATWNIKADFAYTIELKSKSRRDSIHPTGQP